MTKPSSSKRGGLRGPRPQPLKVSSSSARGSSPPSSRSTKKLHGGAGAALPVIVYEYTPNIVHARPQEFMTVVQRLTGKPASSPPLPTTSTYAPAVQDDGVTTRVVDMFRTDEEEGSDKTVAPSAKPERKTA